LSLDVRIDGDLDVVLEIGPAADREHAPRLPHVRETAATLEP
jgi:hypothetical protein